MNILIVTDLYPIEKDAGIPSVIEDYAKALKDFGANVSIIRPNFLLNSIIRKRKFIKQGVYLKDGIKIYNRNFYLPFLSKNIKFLEGKFDIIISHMPSGNIWADEINKILKLPRIAIVHYSDYRVLNDFKYKFYFGRKLKNALKSANLVGARNKFLYEKLNCDFILPSFIEKKYILKNKEISEKLNIVTLSKLIKRKNINIVIEALKEADFDYSYNIWGSGNQEKSLKKLIKKNNLEDKIKIHPYTDHEKIYDILDKNSVFILPSVNESFGLSYLEAMARGLITIGTKNTGIDGIIKDGKNGFLINPNKKEVLSVLKKINKTNKEEIIKNTLSEIENYKKEKIIKKYFEIIKKIL